MRRWELVGDGSAKFWEAAVEGAGVRVRYGRIGTDGREQLKELASVEAAAAHVAKQVAEKERKGYAEVAAGGVAAAAPRAAAAAPVGGGEGGGVRELPDEDAFVMPAAWWKAVLPRRAGRIPEVAWPGPEALERERRRIDGRRQWVERVLDAPASEPELVRAARAYLDGAPDVLGAVAVASVLPAPWQADAEEKALFADVWTARHGLPFAVRAVLERHTVETSYLQSGSDISDISLRRRITRPSHYRQDSRPIESQLRALLAAAPEPEYREALAAAAEHRGTPRHRALACYLAPNVPGWLAECLADMPGYGDERAELQTLLLHALDDPAQVEPAGADLQRVWRAWPVTLVATLAESVGTAFVPLLREAFEQAHDATEARELAAVLAQLPTDAAFRLLLARLEDKQVRPVLQEALQRYPVRAVRLLAEAAARDGRAAATARRLLDTHVLLHRELLPQILPRLDAAAAALVAELDGARPQAPEAAPEALPPLLAAPPWTRPRTRRKARVVEGLRPDEGLELAWRAGEREGWARFEFAGWQYPADTDWAAEAKDGLEHHNLWYPVRLLVQGPPEVLAPLLAEWRPADLWGGSEYLPPVVAKYGPAALPMALHAAGAKPGVLSSLLLPFREVRAARLLADGLVRLKSVHATARSWFARHGVAGALLLVPDAVG
ncbi:MAG: WGR domain-containing protein, partial [Kitasatospora sp.]|nr:WGR domain-containing protein [Kitasatospora sp.]